MRNLQWLSKLVALALLPTPSLGMDFATLPLADGFTAITANGDIMVGDDSKLHALVDHLPRSVKLVGIMLNSNGGRLSEGMLLARTIRASNFVTVVPYKAICASACFLMFAAGRDRSVADNALVGVHSAYDAANGGENTMSQSATILMAREAAGYGVPPSVIGRMVTTEGSSVSWLTAAEMLEMDIVKIPTEAATPAYQPGSALVPGRAASSAPSAPIPGRATPSAPRYSTSQTQPAADARPMFNQGLKDRKFWEQWFSELTGDYKVGAEWWVNHRNYAIIKPYCRLEPKVSLEFVNGCFAAQGLLTPFDRQRLASPKYASGWNSL